MDEKECTFRGGVGDDQGDKRTLQLSLAFTRVQGQGVATSTLIIFARKGGPQIFFIAAIENICFVI